MTSEDDERGPNLFLGEINTETWSSKLGVYKLWDSKIQLRVLRDSNPRKTALARPNSKWKLHTHPLVREGVPHQQTRNCLKEQKGREIDPGYQMSAWHQDWPSVVIQEQSWDGSLKSRRLVWDGRQPARTWALYQTCNVGSRYQAAAVWMIVLH
jgi:hypothetical protein